MPTINQLLTKNIRNSKIYSINSPALKSSHSSSPQLKALVLKVLILKPKKPNSAKRKVVKVLLSNNKSVYAYISGIGHNLQPHSIVLIKGGKTQDLPNVNYKVIRGAYDCLGVQNRLTSRSKYGTKKPI